MAEFISWSNLVRGLITLIGAFAMALVLFTSSGDSTKERNMTVLAGGGRLALLNGTDQSSLCWMMSPSPVLTQFLDPLPIIPVINVTNGRQLVMKAYKFSQKLHSDLPATTVYGFGTSSHSARYPGPALQAKRNVPSHIRWENHISDHKHFLAVDSSIHTAMPRRGGVPIVPHLHGMESESAYDGHPEAWFTRSNDTGPCYVTQNYVYPNSIRPQLIWYHDHTVGFTRLNVVAGLAGPYVVRGAERDEPRGLPRGTEEVFLLIQDRQFFSNGSINFPSVGDDSTLHPKWCPGYYGDTILVNGKVWPYLEVMPFKYRLRMLNGASDRYLDLSLDKFNLTFLKIGTDGGYLREPIPVDHILLAPGERVDCIVDFGALGAGDAVVMNNSAVSAYPNGPALGSASGERTVLQFRVVANSSADPSAAAVPAVLSDYSRPMAPAAEEVRSRQFSLSQSINNVGNETLFLLNNRTWEDRATELPHVGSTEIWSFISLTPRVAHPIHIHLVKLHVLDVQPVNASAFENGTCTIRARFGDPGSCFLGPARPPDAQELGWKDIVTAWPGNVTRVLIRFTSQDGSPFPFDSTRGPGYLWHCHLLSHEDNSMMRPMYMRN